MRAKNLTIGMDFSFDLNRDRTSVFRNRSQNKKFKQYSTLSG